MKKTLTQIKGSESNVVMLILNYRLKGELHAKPK